MSNTAEDRPLISKRVCLEWGLFSVQAEGQFWFFKKKTVIFEVYVSQQSGDQLLLQKVQLLRDPKHYKIIVAIAMLFSLRCLLKVFCY